MIIAMALVIFLLVGCTQSPAPKTTEKPPVPEKKVEKTTPQPVKEAKPVVKTEEPTLGEGKNAIKESELPTYDASQDKELEELTKGLEK